MAMFNRYVKLPEAILWDFLTNLRLLKDMWHVQQDQQDLLDPTKMAQGGLATSKKPLELQLVLAKKWSYPWDFYPCTKKSDTRIATWWLSHPSEKWWSSSVGMMTHPNTWKVIKMVPNPPTRLDYTVEVWRNPPHLWVSWSIHRKRAIQGQFELF